MASALAMCGSALGEPKYTHAAVRNCRWLLKNHGTPDGGLFRTSRDGGGAKFAGFLDDYAALAHACLATGDVELKAEAERLVEQMLERFGSHACHPADQGEDAEEPKGEAANAGHACGGGGCGNCGSGSLFFTDASADDLMVRQKVATDSPLPSGNALALDVLRQLGRTDRATALLRELAQSLEDNAEAMSGLLGPVMKLVRGLENPVLTLRASGAGPKREAAPATPQELAHQAVQVEARFSSETELLIRLTIADGYHINGPAGSAEQLTEATAGGVKTELSFPGANVMYPPPQRLKFPLAPDPLEVYTGQVVFTVKFHAAPTQTIQGALRYQPCTDDACLPVIVQPLELRGQ
jgi:uncharacterized protein YyaL (SSP411 family)